MIEDGAGFRTKGPQGGRGSRRQGGPGSRMWLLGEDSTLRCGAGGPGPCEDGAGGCSADVAVGPGPSLALSCSQSPELTQAPSAAAEGRA